MKAWIGILLLFLLFAIGCGTSSRASFFTSGCFITGITVSPATATVDHLAFPPGNSQQFFAFQSSAPAGCSFTATTALQTAVWTISDPANASISNLHDQMNVNFGRATCISFAPAPIAVTATVPAGNGSNVSASAVLTCR